MAYKIGSHRYELEPGWGKLPEGYEFHQVAGVAVDAQDRVYVFNRSSHQLMVFDRAGNLVRVWGQKFTLPHGIHIGPDGNIYLVDTASHVVLKYTPNERLLLTLGTRDAPSDTGYTQEERKVKRAAGPFHRPTGVVVNGNGDIFVSDGYGNCRVHKFDARGTLLTSWGRPGTVRPGEFNLPHGIGLDAQGRLLVCDRENHRIQVFSQDGDYVAMWTGFRQPTDVVTGPDGTVYVPELQSRVTIVDGAGKVLARWGEEDSHEPGKFASPHGIALDSHGDVYVGEVLEGKRIQKFVRR